MGFLQKGYPQLAENKRKKKYCHILKAMLLFSRFKRMVRLTMEEQLNVVVIILINTGIMSDICNTNWGTTHNMDMCGYDIS